MRRSGITLVEVFIVLIVVGAILAILIPIFREQERQRLQALANAEPWEVFEFRAEPAKESFTDKEDIVIRCEIVNPTLYPLTLPQGLDNFRLIFGDTNYFAGYVRPSDTISGMAIAPKESATFDIAFLPFGTGAAEVRIVYETDLAAFQADWASTTTTPVSLELSPDGTMRPRIGAKENSVLIAARYFYKEDGKTFHFTNLRGVYTSKKRRFHSDSFTLKVNESDSSHLPTFDEIVAEIEQLESSPEAIVP